MKAVGLYQGLPSEDSQSLLDLEIATPTPNSRDLLVKVQAISVNPVDTKQRMNTEASEMPRILGYDAVGEIIATGEEVTMYKEGDVVYFAGDVTRQGHNAEYTLIDERLVALKPKSLTVEEAAAMPLTTLTAWEALFDRLGIDAEKDAGKTILIINGAGGVGSIATQLARLSNLYVVTTASRKETISWCKENGADRVIDHHKLLKQQLSGLDIDYILCLHDTSTYLQTMLKLIKPQGKICTIVELSEPADLDLLKDKSATFVYEFMFTRSKYQTEDQIKQHEILTKAAHYFDQGKLKSTLKQVLEPFNAETMRKAHLFIESGHSIGKLVVKGFES
ncbi:zinc-binding alcohol dehydrogenase family protein [Listeria sp. PSOL-1]|uniref:zinc-binding alcohol dehydrogenase family protein n=1 Tax=Listeria sp. PSOL-1 TaxID=1844999 RepID=UPI0013CF892C|nr:zinc-binding alcohol dehydrogenase family protein [Listeria sp. PSOL-1]